MNIAILTKESLQCTKQIDALTKEIAGKKSVLEGAFKDIKKGEPNYKTKRFIEKNLPIDEKNLKDWQKKQQKVASALLASISILK